MKSSLHLEILGKSGGGGRRGQLLEHFLTDSGSDSSLMDPVIFSKTAVPPLTCFYHLQFLRPALSPLGLQFGDSVLQFPEHRSGVRGCPGALLQSEVGKLGLGRGGPWLLPMPAPGCRLWGAIKHLSTQQGTETHCCFVTLRLILCGFYQGPAIM